MAQENKIITLLFLGSIACKRCFLDTDTVPNPIVPDFVLYLEYCCRAPVKAVNIVVEACKEGKEAPVTATSIQYSALL